MELLTGITATLELPSILGSDSNLPRPCVLAAYNNVDWVLFPHYTAADSQQYGVLQCAAVSQKRDDVIIATAPLRLRPATKSMTAVLLRNQSSLFACLWPCSSNRVTFLCVCVCGWLIETYSCVERSLYLFQIQPANKTGLLLPWRLQVTHLLVIMLLTLTSDLPVMQAFHITPTDWELKIISLCPVSLLQMKMCFIYFFSGFFEFGNTLGTHFKINQQIICIKICSWF